MTDQGTQHYINEERARCAKLVEMLSAEPAFLIYCIKAPIYPTENIESHRRRFAEYAPEPPEDEFGDLM